MRLIISSLLAIVLASAIGCSNSDKPPVDGAHKTVEGDVLTEDGAAISSYKLGEDGSIEFGHFKTTLPEGWKAVEPQSKMRAAQFDLPAADGDTEDGLLAVFYLGPQAGGIEANLDRWYAQFDRPDGKSAKEFAKTEELMIGEWKTTWVEFEGTKKPSTMPGSLDTGSKTGWKNISAIVETPEGPWFFKGTGPVKTMDAQSASIRAIVTNLHR